MGTLGDDVALVDDDEVVAGVFDFWEDVAGDEDGHLVFEVFDEGTDGEDLVGVEAYGGFV